MDQAEAEERHESRDSVDLVYGLARAAYSLSRQPGHDGAVTVRKAVTLDRAFTDAVQSLLSDWDSDKDDEAFRGL